MPYIVTTKRRVIEDEFGVERDRSEVRARRAVATLEEAREYADALLMGACDPSWPLEPLMDACYAIPESGGTVGPLPDGTVIQVERVSLAAAVIRDLADNGFNEADILAAFNAREERSTE